MDTLEIVNFEDLFEFSPEPFEPKLEGKSNAEDSAGPTLRRNSPQNGSFCPVSIQTHLSASLPTQREISALSASYTGSSSPGGSSSLGFCNLDSSGAVDSNESLSNLLDELSSAVASSAPASGVKGKRGRKPGQKKSHRSDKLERSRQSAKECRARKKLRYQYLDDLILEREKANMNLREELLLYQDWCHQLDKGKLPDDLKDYLQRIRKSKEAVNELDL